MNDTKIVIIQLNIQWFYFSGGLHFATIVSKLKVQTVGNVCHIVSSWEKHFIATREISLSEDNA